MGLNFFIMKPRITRRDFFELLPEDVRAQAIDAINAHSHLTLDEALDEVCDGSGSGNPLSSVFYWTATEQGHDYWEEVNAKYFSE